MTYAVSEQAKERLARSQHTFQHTVKVTQCYRGKRAKTFEIK